MKQYKLFLGMMISAISLVGCQKWTETERIVYDNQNVEKLVYLMEAETEADLNQHTREYYKKLREEYRTRPRVKGFGWFGNWSAKGDNPQNYLKSLPDSVDFVSMWGTRGKLSEEQKKDLKFFQDVKGGKALLCWIVQDIGGPLTPVGKDRTQYWIREKGNGDLAQAARAYANAIADTIEKYNFDGFDIDYEPMYGHSGDLADMRQIEGNHAMQAFIETLSSRLRPAGRMLVMDGEPGRLSTETSKLIDHYIYQAYWEYGTNAVINKIRKEHLTDWERKTIITVEFEQGWREGGTTYYSSNRPEIQALGNGKGKQILDYATLDLPSGKRIGGIGTYHMEYDYANNPEYKWLRKAIYYGNQKFPGNFQ